MAIKLWLGNGSDAAVWSSLTSGNAHIKYEIFQFKNKPETQDGIMKPFSIGLQVGICKPVGASSFFDLKQL